MAVCAPPRFLLLLVLLSGLALSALSWPARAAEVGAETAVDVSGEELPSTHHHHPLHRPEQPLAGGAALRLLVLALALVILLQLLWVRRLRERLAQQAEALRHEASQRFHLEGELRRLESTDELTGMANRRSILEMGEAELERYRHFHQPFALALVNLDHFKRINDQYGPDAGDHLLRELVHFYRRELGEGDRAGRLGGEEFLIILAGTHEDPPAAIMDRLRKSVEESRFQLPDGEPIQVTLSIGLTGPRATDEAFKDMLARADHAVGEAKQAGRNRVCEL